ncbi:MAG: hypothetical protein JRC60_05700 [Deltaproteobacteria bacterium]|nr:hypothetical protein [Deltaproteobacteria bacterium]
MTDNHIAAYKVPLVSADELRIAKERGEDISYDEEDRHVEAYLFNGQMYVAGVRELGPGE